ncbi:MAG: type III-B CRISPR module-associated Cmr3 family protein [Candidatus Binataceae bacterium]
MMTTLRITCRDPIVSRDGRPFGAGQGNRMRGLDWVLPSVLAGALRTTLGKAEKRDFSIDVAEDLLRVEVAGPFPLANQQLYLPAPDDCVVHPEKGPLRAVPQPLDKGGCDWPATGLQPVGLTDTGAPEEFKPEQTPPWWPEERVAAWLADDKEISFDNGFLLAPEKVERTHVKLNSATGAAEDGALFTTTALALTDLLRHGVRAQEPRSSRFAAITLVARVRASGWCGETAARLDTLHPLGGERRLVHWKAAETNAWSCPERVREALATTSRIKRIRMVLATPAIFRDGWKPGWLNDELVGTPPGATVSLRLVGVSIQRWRAVSGWSLTELPAALGRPQRQPRGPKPVKRVVPSGGVYFFENDEKASELAGLWLESVSDDEQDRRDGFGLAVWGIW